MPHPRPRSPLPRNTHLSSRSPPKTKHGTRLMPRPFNPPIHQSINPPVLPPPLHHSATPPLHPMLRHASNAPPHSLPSARTVAAPSPAAPRAASLCHQPVPVASPATSNVPCAAPISRDCCPTATAPRSIAITAAPHSL